MFSFRSFQTKLFITYSLVLIIIATVVSIPMYIYLKNNIENNITNNVDQITLSYKESFEQYSSLFENISYQFYLNQDYSGYNTIDYFRSLFNSEDTLELYQANITLSNFISLTSSMYSNIYRINLFTMAGSFFSNHVADVSLAESLRRKDWLKPALQAEGGTVIEYNANDRWFSSDNTALFSFYRQLDPKGIQSGHGFLEMQIKLTDLLSLDKLNNLDGSTLTLFNRDQILFTTSVESEKAQLEKIVQYRQTIGNAVQGNSNIHQPGKGNEYIFFQSSEKTGLTVLLSIPEKKVFASLRIFRNVTIMIVLFLILFSVFVFYVLSRSLTYPLNKLKHVIDEIDLEDKSLGIDNKYQQDEIELINRSFRKMNNRLRDTLEEVVQFRTLQLQSQFDTLQSQINPHFLFNMLGVINVLVEEGELKQISHVSTNLSSFLRYSIATSSPVTSLDKEIDFAERYLGLMKMRYLHRLSYEIQIDERMHHLLMPKLTLQPLVENCIQHGYQDARNSLAISIYGSIRGEQWELLICDNGSGFTDEVLMSVRGRIQAYLDGFQANSADKTLTFGGMGLTSTFARLKFLFKDQLFFTLGNNEDGGAFIRIAGNMKA